MRQALLLWAAPHTRPAQPGDVYGSSNLPVCLLLLNCRHACDFSPTPSHVQNNVFFSSFCPCCRRVFDPIQISLRHSKVGSNANPRRRSAMSSRGSRHRSPGVAGFGASGRGEELLLRVGALGAGVAAAVPPAGRHLCGGIPPDAAAILHHDAVSPPLLGRAASGGCC